MSETTAAPVAPGSILEWDSDFFGCRIARLDAAPLLEDAARVERWCRASAVDCAYLLVEADDQRACDAASAHGFRLVDIRVTLESSGPAVPAADARALVRPAVAADIGALKAIARAGHRATRFYADGRFSPSRCDDLYELWIEKSCGGWADHVLVADAGAGPVGYITCHRRADHGQIGLVGVDAASRGQGTGRALMAAARRWFDAAGCAKVAVVTQGRNAAGLRLYQSAGMTVCRVQLWFHRWWT